MVFHLLTLLLLLQLFLITVDAVERVIIRNMASQIAKLSYTTLKSIGRAGGTWPGEIALRLDKSYLSNQLGKLPQGFVLVTGTNGKTTTTHLLVEILRVSGLSVVTNSSGANLPNGLASAFIEAESQGKTPDIGVFEIDENYLPLILDQANPRIVLITNIFRDQLDRFGEIETIKNKWMKSLYGKGIQLVLNSDDPAVAAIGLLGDLDSKYFGIDFRNALNFTNLKSPKDSGFCLRCGEKLNFKIIFYSHLGDWSCPNCGLERPEPSELGGEYSLLLPGNYNQYNVAGSILASSLLGIERSVALTVSESFVGVFGRGETIDFEGGAFELHLAKNPTGFTQSLSEVRDALSPVIVLLLNDKIADGQDISWIWDIGLEEIYIHPQHLIIGGSRANDLALRLFYAGIEEERLHVFDDLHRALIRASQLSHGEKVPIVATYTAMLKARKILLGKSLL